MFSNAKKGRNSLILTQFCHFTKTQKTQTCKIHVETFSPTRRIQQLRTQSSFEYFDHF